MSPIESDRQYEITKKRIEEVNGQIEKLSSRTNNNPLRKELILTSLEIFNEELEQQLAE